ncbi:Ig-like domain-containing protein [Luteolibacter flavescens]|uniref:Ig-like domain-containing protein n=1 Tax=Luteolibacter flavescens TaxID=1859460 RepID=A0ABT3FRH5_9BACT|nr:Ig-like domain-containing protein [Luteolibacter flavescens]MCW1886185.1 Ig-like domain-containing protein [Luteolibacter flavescens]
MRKPVASSSPRLAAPLAAAWLTGIASVAAAPIITPRNSGPNTPSTATDELAYAEDVSTTDLLHGLTGTGGTWNANGSSPAGLNDGVHGADSDAAGISALAGTAWSRDGSNVSFREFVLGAGPGGLGYDITNIQSIAAWQGAGFANQRYEVRVRLVGESAFQTSPVATVNYQPYSATLNEGGATRVRITDSTGKLASGVEAIRFDVLDTVGNAAGGTVFREIDVHGAPTASTTDTVAPVVVSLFPENRAVSVGAGATLTADFHEPITLGTGTVTLKNTTTQAETVITLPDPRVTVSGRTLAIRPGLLVAGSSPYAVRLSAGVVADAAGNSFAGIADDTTWSFTTAAPDTRTFTLDELAYTGDASAHDLLHGITPVTTGWNTGNGAHPTELTDGIHGRNFASIGNSVEGAWTTVGATAVYQLGAGPNGTGYDLTSIHSIASWVDVSFGNQAWTVDVKPLGGSYTTLATVNYQPLNGKGATKVVLGGTGPLLAGGIEAIRFTANQVNGGANAGAFVWRELDVFGHAAAPLVDDGTPPTLVSLVPADDATDVSPSAALVATFDEAITAGSGSIRIRNLDTAAETVIPVTDPRISLAGTTLTITPSPRLAPLTRYAVLIDAGAVEDFHDDAFAGIADDVTWSFTTGRTPLRIMPMGDSITAGYTDNPVWNEPFWYGYRSGLYNRLHAAGYDFTFVGQSTELPSHVAGTTPPADLAALDQNKHNGYGGQAAGYLNANIQGWLANDDPDVILLKIGTNSADQNGLDTLIQTITTTSPDTYVIVAEIMPKYNYEQGVVNYNSWIRQTLVPKYQNLGKRVSRVDQYAPFLTNPADLESIDRSLFSNGINHPDNDGYDKMAAVWFSGIEALGLNQVSYSEWIANPAYGIAVGDRGFASDPDGDGIPNGVEAWLGTHPGEANAGLGALVAVPAAGAGSGTGFSFSHSLNATPPAGLGASYQWSTDLLQWHDADGTDGPAGGPTVTASITGTATTANVLAIPSTPVERLFLRLSVASD